jgi:hypothetical protein
LYVLLLAVFDLKCVAIEHFWVVQEVVKALLAFQKCGHDSMSWLELATAFHVFSKVYLSSGFPIHPNVATIRLVMDLPVPDSDQNKLSFLLDQLSIRSAEHPTNKKFAILGLLSAEDRSLVPVLEPDYRVDIRDLYMDATFHPIPQDRNLNVLSTCHPSNHNIPNLPF